MTFEIYQYNIRRDEVRCNAEPEEILSKCRRSMGPAGRIDSWEKASPGKTRPVSLSVESSILFDFREGTRKVVSKLNKS